MFKKALLIIFLLGSFTVMASTFLPISIEDQIKGSDGAMEVSLKSSKAFLNFNNQIVTEYIFKIKSTINLDKNDFPNNELHLVLPGGTVNEITTQVIGAPDFKYGVNTFLMLKKVEGRIYLSNYSVGKFNIQKVNGEDYLVNEVFPAIPGVGRIKKSHMLALMKKEWSIASSNKEVVQNKIGLPKLERVNTSEIVTKRELASVEETRTHFNMSQWFIFVLAGIGIVFAIVLALRGKSEGE